MSESTIELRGFEGALMTWLGVNFRFAEVGLKSIPLVPGRTLFVNFMPEPGSILQTSAADVTPYDPKKEPTITAYTNAGQGVRPSSSRGGKHEANLQLVLRVVGSFERAKELLEEVTQFLKGSVKGKRMGTFICRSFTISARPTAFQRQNDDRSFAQSTVRILYIALNS